jgi:L-aminopeptidase/D-esterase-like protein
MNSLTDVVGLRVGHAQRIGDGWLSGVTVVLGPEGGMVAAVDVRGGGPGTRETDALDPRNLVQRIDAVVLTGGSAFGLDTATGVAAWLEEQQRGVRVGPEPGQVVPVVPAAASTAARTRRWVGLRWRPPRARRRARLSCRAASGPAPARWRAG